MKTLKSLVNTLTIILILFSSTISDAQIIHIKTESVKIYGNCDMCKKKIEAAAYSKKVSSAVWNKDSKVAILSYDSTKISSDAILKKIAFAGYDNQNYLAPNVAYSKLDGCCQYDRKQNNMTKVQHDMHTATDHKNISQQSSEQNLLSPVYVAYFALKDALIKGDGNLAASKAKELFNAVDAVPMDKLPVAQHAVWMEHMKDISYNAEHIKGTTEVDHQREHFAKLSLSMYEVIKVIKPEYPVYYDNCPMYNDGKGANWLSKESAIKNPYYGSQMLSCGSTKETIK